MTLTVFTITALRDDLTPGTYTAAVIADYGSGTTEKAVSFKVKRSVPAPAASLTLKTAGSIDVLRPGSAVTLTPTFKNCYDYDLDAADIAVTKTYDGASKTKVSADATGLFQVTVKEGKYVLCIAEGAAVSHLDKFTVTATVNGIASKAAALKLLQGKAAVAQSTKAVTLVKTDRYSRGEVKLTLTDPALAGIREVKLISPADKEKRPYFSLAESGDGVYEIFYYENLLPNEIVKLKTQTVKLQVFLEGNQTAAPNVTLSIKVNLA